ncbi:unnamed protein product, partial [Rotaria socialis]
DPNKPLLFGDQVPQAEILWAPKSVQNAFIYKKSDDVDHAQANVVVDGILGAFRTDGIDISKLLMFSRDNPNVNKTVDKMINDAMKKVNAELLNIGTCNLHVIHNGFRAGTTETIWGVENFCMNIWSWFQKSPARQEDFENIADELNDVIEKPILYFSSTRWVLLGKVIDRVLKQYHMFREYFLVYLPSKQQKQIQSNSCYDNIKEKEGPLVHLLYDELCDLYRTVLLYFLSPEKQLTTKKLQIGEEAHRLLVDVSASDRVTLFHDVKLIYHAIVDNLKKHLPLKNTFLKDLHVLDSASRTKPDSADTMIRVGRAIPKLLSDAEIDRIRHEFMMYAAETIDQSWYIKNKYHDSDGNNHTEYQQIDYYWNKT